MTSTRRTLLIAGALLLGLVGAAEAQDKRFDGVTLRVGTWGGTNRDALRDLIATEFEKLGGKVEFVIGSPQDSFAKIIATRGRGVPPIDAFELIGALVPEVEGRGMFAKLNYANIPNARFLDPSGRRETMAATWTTQEVLVYNADKFRELGLAPPKKLTDLADPKLAGRVMLPDISSGGGLEAVGAFAMTAGAGLADVDPGLQLIKAIPRVKFWKAGGELVTAFKSGDVWAGVAHAGWAVRTRYAGVPVETVTPDFGAHVGLLKEGWIGVVRGSKQQAAAEWYIDRFLSEDVQYEMAVKTGTVPTNPVAWGRLGATPVIKELVVTDPARIGRMAKLDFSKVDLSRWNDQWNRIVAQQ